MVPSADWFTQHFELLIRRRSNEVERIMISTKQYKKHVQQQMSSKGMGSKVPPADGIFLDGNEINNWSAWDQQFTSYITTHYPKLIRSIKQGEHILKEMPDPLPEDATRDERTARTQLIKEISASNEIYWEKQTALFGDIMLHISHASESKARNHSQWHDAFIAEDSVLLYKILRETHVVPMESTEAAIIHQLRKLFLLAQGQMPLQDYTEKFTSEWEKLKLLGETELSERTIVRLYMVTLEGQFFGKYIADIFATPERIPNNLRDAIRMVDGWVRHTTNMIEQSVTARDAQEHAYATEKATPKCPICGKYANHTALQCYKLKDVFKQWKQDEGKIKEKKTGNFKRFNYNFTRKKESTPTTTTHEKRGKFHNQKRKRFSNTGETTHMAEINHESDEQSFLILVQAAQEAQISSDSVMLDTGSTVSIFNHADRMSTNRLKKPTVINGIGGSVNIRKTGEHPVFGKVLISPESHMNIVSFGILEEQCDEVLYDNEKKTFTFIKNNMAITFTRQPMSKLYLLTSVTNQPSNYSITTAKQLVVTKDDDSDNESTDDQSVATTDIIPNPTITKREKAQAAKVLPLCKCLSHPSKAALIRIIKSGCLKNINITEKDVNNSEQFFGTCPSCVAGKITKHKMDYIQVDQDIGPDEEILHSDFVFLPGPNETTVFLLSVGHRSRLIQATKLRTRDIHSVTQAFSKQLTTLSKHGIRVKGIYTDGENVFTSIQEYLNSRQIELIQQTANIHERFVERRVRTIKERIRATLKDLTFELPRRFYFAMVAWIVQSLNVTPDSLSPPNSDIRTQYEIATGIKPDLNHISRAHFGQVVIFHKDNTALCNTDDRSDIGLIIGRQLRTGQVQICSFSTQSTCWRSSFKETPLPSLYRQKLDEWCTQDKIRTSTVEELSIANTPFIRLHRDSYKDMDDSDSEASEQDPSSASRGEIIPTKTIDTLSTAGPTNGRGRKYPTRQRKSVYSNIVLSISLQQALRTMPTEASKAINEELTKLLQYKVFSGIEPTKLTPEIQRAAVPCHMFLKEKYDANNAFCRLRSRLVAGGNLQTVNPYENNSSPTIAWEAVLTAVAAAFHNNWKVATTDVPSAYLHQKLLSTVPGNENQMKQVYMYINPTLTKFLVKQDPNYEKFVNSTGSVYVRIEKALYGLKQSAKLFYLHLRETLYRADFHPIQEDKSLFIKKEGDRVIAYILAHVDDLMILAENDEIIKNLHANLQTTYGDMNMITGTNFSWLGTNFLFNKDYCRVNNNGYLEALLEKYQIKGTAKIPTRYNFNDEAKDGDKSLWDKKLFQKMVAELLYLAKRSRPDILYAVSNLSTRTTPNMKDKADLYYLLRYLNGSKQKSIVFHRKKKLELEAFADASYNSHQDGKSHTGILIYLCGGIVFSRSSKQKLITKSSCEAELQALDDCCDIAVWLTRLLKALGQVVQPPCIHQDNVSTIHIATHDTIANRSRRYFRVKIASIRDYILSKLVVLKYTKSKSMLADILTKAVKPMSFASMIVSIVS